MQNAKCRVQNEFFTFYSVLRLPSILPLIAFIECRDDQIDNLQVSDGAMAAAGVDHDGSERFNWDALAVEIQEPLPLQNKVDFGRSVVIVCARIRLDLDEMNAGRRFTRIGKGTSRDAAGALDARQGV